MELEILKHTILSVLVNIIVYFFIAVLLSLVISLISGIKNDSLPFGWIGKLFKGLKSVLTPLGKWLWEKLLVLLKILLKLILFALEQLFLFLVDLFRKLFDLIRDPDD